jgi:hypothetical protein
VSGWADNSHTRDRNLGPGEEHLLIVYVPWKHVLLREMGILAEADRAMSAGIAGTDPSKEQKSVAPWEMVLNIDRQLF